MSYQENRSFDHYFGFAPQVQAAGFDPPEVTMARTPVNHVIAIRQQDNWIDAGRLPASACSQ